MRIGNLSLTSEATWSQSHASFEIHSLEKDCLDLLVAPCSGESFHIFQNFLFMWEFCQRFSQALVRDTRLNDPGNLTLPLTGLVGLVSLSHRPHYLFWVSLSSLVLVFCAMIWAIIISMRAQYKVWTRHSHMPFCWSAQSGRRSVQHLRQHSNSLRICLGSIVGSNTRTESFHDDPRVADQPNELEESFREVSTLVAIKPSKPSMHSLDRHSMLSCMTGDFIVCCSQVYVDEWNVNFKGFP